MTTRRALVAAAAVIVVIVAVLVGRPLIQDLLTPSCGSDRLDPTTGKVTSTAARECILAAYARHAAARSEHVLPTVEGDPVTYVIRLTGRDDFELTIDSTHDRQGSRGITRYQCGGLSSTGGSFSLVLASCQPGGSAIQIQ